MTNLIMTSAVTSMATATTDVQEFMNKYQCFHSFCKWWTSFGPVENASLLFSGLYNAFFLQPLAKLYLLGPSINNNIGFWQGKSLIDICAEITQTSSVFWQNHPSQCFTIVENRFFGFVSVIECLIVFIFWYHIARSAINRCKRSCV